MNKIFQQIGWGGIIGLVGGGIGVLAGGFGVATAGVGPLVFYIVFIVGMGWVFWHFMFGPMVRTNHILDVGIQAEAKILAIAENGSSIQMGGALPKAGVTIQLELHPAGKPTYNAKLNTFISMFEIQNYQPGKTIQVKYDPANPQKVAIAEGTGAMENYHS
ncbi:MAG: DUF3592 domain-containing protein [Patescibacteria group bacterium]